jgi:hypothetical protein
MLCFGMTLIQLKRRFSRIKRLWRLEVSIPNTQSLEAKTNILTKYQDQLLLVIMLLLLSIDIASKIIKMLFLVQTTKDAII